MNQSFASMLDVRPSGCWEWMGDRWRDGHALYRPPIGARCYAERYACELQTGKPPVGQLRNHCGNPKCVRYGGGHWELSKSAIIRTSRPVENREESDLSAKDVDTFNAMWLRGSSVDAIRKRFRLSWVAFQRLAARVQGGSAA